MAGSPSFGQLLRQHRRVAGLTQEELAERAGLSAFTISALERGTNQSPRKDTLALLTEALALSEAEHARLLAAIRMPGGELARASSPDRVTPSGPALVGRAHELALLERFLIGEGPPLLLFAGEPGIGKSRLLAEAARRAAEIGWHVLGSGCTRGAGQQPYAPLLDAMQRRLAGRSPSQQRDDLRGCAWLARLLPELAGGPIEPLPDWTLPPEQERRLIFAAVERYLTNVAGPRGTLLVLDDLQWAGADALDLLAALARAGRPMQLRIVGAYRSIEMQPASPLSMALADLAQMGLVRHHQVTPLPPEDAVRLLDLALEGVATVTPALRDALVRRMGGVPFFLLSGAETLRQGIQGEGSPVPWDVEQSIRLRIAMLSPVAREVLQVAAVAGQVMPRRLLASVTARPEGELLRALAESRRARLLEEVGRDGYRFVHDVIREVVEADLGAAGRAALHRRIAVALEAMPGQPPVEALAYHYAEGDAPERAIPYLERAGDRAWAQHAYGAAEGYYRQLVEQLDLLGQRTEAAYAREKLGIVQEIEARHDEALIALEAAATTHEESGDMEAMARVVAQIGRVHLARATLEEGVARLRPVLARVEADGSPLSQAVLTVALAGLLSNLQADQAVPLVERAVALARAAGDQRLLAEAAERAGWVLSMVGRSDAAHMMLKEAVGLAESHGDLATLSMAQVKLAWVYGTEGSFVAARSWAEGALRTAEIMDSPSDLRFANGMCGHLAYHMGDWEAARSYLEQAVVLARKAGSYYFSFGWLGELDLAAGRWDEAAAILGDVWARAVQNNDYRELLAAACKLAELDILQGRAEAAHTRLTRFGDAIGHPAVWLLPRMAWAELAIGETARAAEHAAQAVAGARATNERIQLGEACRIQALVAIEQARWDKAECAIEEGLAVARQNPSPYLEGRLLQAQGELHRRRGQAEPARECLQEALAIFGRLGAVKEAERAERELAALS